MKVRALLFQRFVFSTLGKRTKRRRLADFLDRTSSVAEEVPFGRAKVTSVDWLSYPTLDITRSVGRLTS
jgi:hypothetical protein